MKSKLFDIGQRPSQARRRQRERRQGRHDIHFIGVKMLCQGNADAEEHRVPRGQHTDRRAATFGNLRHQVGQRARPGQARASVLGEHCEMTVAANQGLRPIDQHPATRGQSVETVFTDPDNTQPSFRHASVRPASALTAAAAMALPPRRPRIVIYGTSCPPAFAPLLAPLLAPSLAPS